MKELLKEMIHNRKNPKTEQDRIILRLLEEELIRKESWGKRSPEEAEAAKKEYLRMYYLKNKPKLNARYKEQAKIARQQSKIIKKLIQGSKMQLQF